MTVAAISEIFVRACQHYQAGNLAQAEQFYKQILLADPNHTDPNTDNVPNCLAVALVQQNKFEEAASTLRQALRWQPGNAETHSNLGSVLARLGRTNEAIESYRQALRLQPGHAQAHYNLGLALVQAGQRDAALGEFQEASRCQPEFAEAHYQLGAALQLQGRLEEAIASYRQAINCNPGVPGPHHHLGTALQSLGRLDEAVASYRQALVRDPNLADTHNNLGSSLQSQGRLGEAVAAYTEALRLNPNFAEAHNNYGLTLQELGKVDQAVICHRRALQLKPEDAGIHTALGRALKRQGQLKEAITCFQRALQLQPNSAAILAELIDQLQNGCVWEDLNDLAQRFMKAALGDAGTVDSFPPFTLLALPTQTTPEQQLKWSQKWVNHCLQSSWRPNDSPVLHHRSAHAKDKITLGYLSADFRIHPVGYLIPELIEKHDRQSFAVIGYSYGPDDGSTIRRRLAAAFDQFIDLREASFLAAAQRIAADGVDILIDLTGYTALARTAVAALRPAPLQVNYLGYPGTMATALFDYIMVDEFVVPPDQQSFFAEKLVHLPCCYQVNDSTREIAAHTPSRAECGLPPTGFVFCCFNSSYKILSEVFEVWMRVLKATPGSVLWLLDNNYCATSNLRMEAQARGVDAQRLVFAPRCPLSEHLARHRLADLFLDTFPYTAHTTASDALWAGCPLLTLVGQTFPSRVAGSLLRSLGLPELICANLQEYEELALRLARDGDFLAGLRARLLANRKTSGLFDGERFARCVEKAYLMMWELHTSGEKPRAFAVGSP